MFKIPFFAALIGLALAATAQEKDTAKDNMLQKGRKKGYGLSFAITPGAQKVDLAPIEELAAREVSLAGHTFDFSNRNMGLLGCRMYAGVGNGVRLGFDGNVGFRSFFSQDYSRDSGTGNLIQYGYDSKEGDSVVSLTLLLAYGGLAVEKAFIWKDVNFIIGGQAGGGALVLFEAFQKKGSAFESSGSMHMVADSTDSLSITATGMDGWVAAPLLTLGAHAAITYSLTSWLHLGGEVNNQLFYSQTGFGGGFREFTTRFNPGWKVRLIFGNLG